MRADNRYSAHGPSVKLVTIVPLPPALKPYGPVTTSAPPETLGYWTFATPPLT
jgi:hypothetical protein